MGEYDNDSKVETKTSKYNSAFDQLARIGFVWKNAYKHSAMGDYNAWNNDLDAVWRELAGDIKENDDEEMAFNKLIVEIITLYPLASAKPPSFNKLSKDHTNKVSKQYLILMKKEIFLRRLQNKLGKGTKWDDTEDDDFG